MALRLGEPCWGGSTAGSTSSRREWLGVGRAESFEFAASSRGKRTRVLLPCCGAGRRRVLWACAWRGGGRKLGVGVVLNWIQALPSSRIFQLSSRVTSVLAVLAVRLPSGRYVLQAPSVRRLFLAKFNHSPASSLARFFLVQSTRDRRSRTPFRLSCRLPVERDESRAGKALADGDGRLGSFVAWDAALDEDRGSRGRLAG